MSTLPAEISTNTSPKSLDVKRYPETGISILIVGAGVGGITTALECWRKGHQVRIIERSHGPVETGDFFTVGPSAIKIFKNWPQLTTENEKIAYDTWVSYYKLTGACIIPPGPMTWEMPADAKPDADIPTRIYRHHRPKFYRMLLDQLEKTGTLVEYDHRAVEYYEDANAGKGGVVLADGKKIEADIVVAADGIGTHSNELVAGRKIVARSSGHSIFRTAYPVEHALGDPEVAEQFKILGNGATVNQFWVGPDMHIIVWRSEDMMSWLFTHKDIGSGTGTESWHNHTPISTVLDYTSTIPDWPSILTRVILTTPPTGIVDWKLMWRDPQSTWTSPHGRVLQLGDAAHTFVPSSGNGATQAMEDAVSLASCLQIGGRSGVEMAVRVHNKLRYERVSNCQLLGFVNQNAYQKTDWDAIALNPNLLKAKYGRWIWSHDAERYAYENYGMCAWLLAKGKGEEWRNTNIPPGMKYKEWTIGELLEKERKGEKIVLEGDWS